MDPNERALEQGDLNPLEQRLGRWRPAPGALDRDRLMFEAGRASGANAWRSRLGFAATACLALVALGLGGALMDERGRRHALETALAARDRTQAAPAPAPSRIVAPDPGSYLALTHRMLADGPDEMSVDVQGHAPSLGPGRGEPPLSPLRARNPGASFDL